VVSVVTGVSGSGKTTLIKQILYPVLKKIAGASGDDRPVQAAKGDYQNITQIERGPEPIGKSSRSNPVTI